MAQTKPEDKWKIDGNIQEQKAEFHNRWKELCDKDEDLQGQLNNFLAAQTTEELDNNFQEFVTLEENFRSLTAVAPEVDDIDTIQGKLDELETRLGDYRIQFNGQKKGLELAEKRAKEKEKEAEDKAKMEAKAEEMKAMNEAKNVQKSMKEGGKSRLSFVSEHTEKSSSS